MNKFKFTTILFILLFSSCGFTPIYVQNNDYNFSLISSEFTGDRDLNNFLKKELRRYERQNSQNKIYISIRSEYEKKILTKNSQGKASNYELIATVIFTIKSNNKEIKFNEKKIMKNMEDKFEEANYERSTKQGFGTSIVNRLISELIIQ